jgi:TetR/AcrR family transcriptional repressor of mexJK operon
MREASGAATPRPRGRAKKREAILAASVELFHSKGYEMTSMDAVAARAGVSKTTVYTHFGDKLALYRAMAERAVTLFDVDYERFRADKERTPAQKLAALTTMLVGSLTSDTFLAFHRVMILEGENSPELTQRLVPGAPYVVDVIADILSEDAARHGYQIDDPRAYAALFVRIAGTAFQVDALMDKNFHPDSDLIAAHSEWVTYMFLKSLRPASVYLRNEEDDERPPAPAYPWLGERLRSD